MSKKPRIRRYSFLFWVMLFPLTLVAYRYFNGFSEAFLNDYSRVFDQLENDQRGIEGLLTRAEIYILFYKIFLGLDINVLRDLLVVVGINSVVLGLLVSSVLKEFNFKQLVPALFLSAISANVWIIFSSGSRESWSIIISFFVLYLYLTRRDSPYLFFPGIIGALFLIYLIRPFDVFTFAVYIYFLLTCDKDKMLPYEIVALILLAISAIIYALSLMDEIYFIDFVNTAASYGEGGSTYLAEVGESGVLEFIVYFPLLFIAFATIPFSLQYLYVGITVFLLKGYIIMKPKSMLVSRLGTRTFLIYCISLLPYSFVVRNQGGGFRWRVICDVILICMLVVSLLKSTNKKMRS